MVGSDCCSVYVAKTLQTGAQRNLIQSCMHIYCEMSVASRVRCPFAN